MIGILNAYHFDSTTGSYQEDYSQLMIQFAQRTFPSTQVRDYKIAWGDWPLTLDECSIWLITGSSKGAYEPVDWIIRLKEFVVGLNQRKKTLIGLCFGHQIIAEALGGRVEKSSAGWGVGVRTFSILQTSRWMKPSQEKISLLFSHQDQVVVAPPAARILAGDSFCPYQMLEIEDHILALQGHPEFDREFATRRLHTVKEKLQPSHFAAALQSFTMNRDDQLISRWVREFALNSR